MNLKGTETEKNVRTALLGESLARNKYTFYAERARKEGNQDLASLFERMATNESTHAKIWFTTLFGEIKGNLENLKDAASGEFDEWSDMYPNFAAVARKEGFDQIADMFERVASIEKDHEKQFMEATAKLMRNPKNTAENPGQAVAPEEEQVAKKTGYRCIFCGGFVKEKLNSCPVCKAIGSYEPCEILEYR